MSCSSLPRRALPAILLLAGLSLQAPAEPVARFWLENTITRKAYGPVLNVPGYRFQIETDGFVVVAAQPGQVLFATFPQTQYLGPFDLQPARIVDLGEKAYAIVQLDTVETPQIPDDVLPAAQRAPIAPAVIPPGRAPEPIPVEPWTLEIPDSLLVTALWFEPFHSTKYDWTLGEHEGERASDLDLSRIGATLAWNGLEASLGLSFGGEHADSVMSSTNNMVTGLKLKEGSGFYAALGYVHRIPLDRRWHAFVGGVLEYRDESYDLTATVFDGTETVWVEAPVVPPPDDPGGSPPDEQPEPEMIEEQVSLHRSVAGSATLRDLALSVRGGIVYEADAWGARMELLLNAWDDTSVDGKVEVLWEELSLGGSRAHPVTVAAAAWCYVVEGVWTEAKFTFGAETAMRLGVGYEW